jgi:hypothetical protein
VNCCEIELTSGIRLGCFDWKTMPDSSMIPSIQTTEANHSKSTQMISSAKPQFELIYMDSLHNRMSFKSALFPLKLKKV